MGINYIYTGNDVLPCSKHTKKNVEKPRLVDHVEGKPVGLPQAPLKKTGGAQQISKREQQRVNRQL